MIRPAVVCLLLLTACTAGTAGREPPDPPSPSPSPSPPLSPEQQLLARLASKTATARYDALYGFEAPATKDVGLLRIVASPPDYRVDIANRGSTSIFIVTPARTVSCSITGSKRSCFLVARAGEEVPDLFDPGVQHLFSDAVADLGRNPHAYVVRRTQNIRLPGGLPDGYCFDVRRLEPVTGGEDPVGFESGRYCFAELGVMTLLAVETGRITLRRLGGPPRPADFQPIAPVAALPDLTPSPAPSR